MIKSLHLLVCYLYIFTYCLQLNAQSNSPEQNENSKTAQSKYSLATFGIYGTSFYQKNGDGNSRSAFLLYSPNYNFSDNLKLIADFGGTYLNTETSKFCVFNLDFRIAYLLFRQLRIDLSLGSQYWAGEGGLAALMGSSLAYIFESRFLGLINSFRIGTNHVAIPHFPTWQYFIGIEIGFGE